MHHSKPKKSTSMWSLEGKSWNRHSQSSSVAPPGAAWFLWPWDPRSTFSRLRLWTLTLRFIVLIGEGPDCSRVLIAWHSGTSVFFSWHVTCSFWWPCNIKSCMLTEHGILEGHPLWESSLGYCGIALIPVWLNLQSLEESNAKELPLEGASSPWSVGSVWTNSQASAVWSQTESVLQVWDVLVGRGWAQVWSRFLTLLLAPLVFTEPGMGSVARSPLDGSLPNAPVEMLEGFRLFSDTKAHWGWRSFVPEGRRAVAVRSMLHFGLKTEEHKPKMSTTHKKTQVDTCRFMGARMAAYCTVEDMPMKCMCSYLSVLCSRTAKWPCMVEMILSSTRYSLPLVKARCPTPCSC